MACRKIMRGKRAKKAIIRLSCNYVPEEERDKKKAPAEYSRGLNIKSPDGDISVYLCNGRDMASQLRSEIIFSLLK